MNNSVAAAHLMPYQTSFVPDRCSISPILQLPTSNDVESPLEPTTPSRRTGGKSSALSSSVEIHLASASLTGFSPLRKQLRKVSRKGEFPAYWKGASPTYFVPPIFKLADGRKSSRGDFACFARLPYEIRRQIWTLSLPGTRIVRVTTSRKHDLFKPCEPVPGILQACRESRLIARQSLKPCFANSWLTGAYTFFNHEVDILKFGYDDDAFDARKMAACNDAKIIACREKVKHIEISFPFTHTDDFYRSIAHLVCVAPHRGWPGLETWTFSDRPDDECTPERMALIIVERKKNWLLSVKMILTVKSAIRTEMQHAYLDDENWRECGLKVVYIDEDERETSEAKYRK